MQAFHIRYRNTQGTLMRILNAVSRRGLDLPYVQAEALESEANRPALPRLARHCGCDRCPRRCARKGRHRSH